MSNGENADFVVRNYKPIKGDISGVPVGNNQLAQFAFDAPPNQGMRGEIINRRLDSLDSAQRCIGIFVSQELKSAFDVV